MTLMTFDKQSNGRRTAVESKLNRSQIVVVTAALVLSITVSCMMGRRTAAIWSTRVPAYWCNPSPTQSLTITTLY